MEQCREMDCGRIKKERSMLASGKIIKQMDMVFM